MRSNSDRKSATKREQRFGASGRATQYSLHSTPCATIPRGICNHIMVYSIYVEELSGLGFFSSYKQHIVTLLPHRRHFLSFQDKPVEL